jgi:hypothetical protein
LQKIYEKDQWTYNSTWEEVHPTGDALFAQTFADKFLQEGVTFYNNQTCYNSEENIISWFQVRRTNFLMLTPRTGNSATETSYSCLWTGTAVPPLSLI